MRSLMSYLLQVEDISETKSWENIQCVTTKRPSIALKALNSRIFAVPGKQLVSLRNEKAKDNQKR